MWAIHAMSQIIFSYVYIEASNMYWLESVGINPIIEVSGKNLFEFISSNEGVRSFLKTHLVLRRIVFNLVKLFVLHCWI